MLSSIAHRIYGNFFMSSRLPEYEKVITSFLREGYQALTIENLWGRITEHLPLPEKALILRHDIDSDVDTARLMWRIERHLGVRGSYYFRLRTVCDDFMLELAHFGSEVGYHFEEVATVIMERGLKSRAHVEACMPEIRARFSRNLLELRYRLGLPLSIVASHGDFLNRRLKVLNRDLLDENLRRELGIKAEVYDEDLASPITCRISDCASPVFWKPEHPGLALLRESPVVYVLVHPRHWRSNVVENLKIDLIRCRDEISYSIAPMLWK